MEPALCKSYCLKGLPDSRRSPQDGMGQTSPTPSDGSYLKDKGVSLRIIYALCLSAATVTHLRVAVGDGLAWDYGGLPTVACVYWTSLTLLDPLAACYFSWRRSRALS